MPWYGRSPGQPPVTARKHYPGHYISIGDGSSRRTTYWKHISASQPNLLTLPGVQGTQLRFSWKELEPEFGVYHFGDVKASYPDTEKSIRAELWRHRQVPGNKQLMVLIEDKSFAGGGIPVPSYMNDPMYVQPTTTGGYCACRWNTYVVERWNALTAALGAALDSEPNFYGWGCTETALSMSAASRAAANYNDVAYRDALIDTLLAASDAFPTSRIFWYTNFFPTISQDYRLQEVANAIKNYQGGNHGILMGGPDILPDGTSQYEDGVFVGVSRAIPERVEPRFQEPTVLGGTWTNLPIGSYGEIELFNSMQNDSFSNSFKDRSLHTTNTPDPRLPGDVWSIGDYWTMDEEFRHGRDNLHLTHIFWNFVTSSVKWKFFPHAADVIAANPEFNV
jgi:hypothetical protein